MSERIAYIGVDLGGTNLRTALVSRSGKILERRSLSVQLDKGAESISNELLSECRALISSGNKLGVGVCAVGLGVAGKIDRQSGAVVFSPNLPELDGYPLAKDVQFNLGIPVAMENDANVFGLGESFAGAAKGIRNWVGITLGTGTGGCLFLGGKLWQGDGLGFSAEVGHMIVEPEGPVCQCGSKGCLEAFASARALVSGAKRSIAGPDPEQSPLKSLDMAGELSAQSIYDCAGKGDRTALALFDKMGRALGICLANIFSLLGIGCAVIGGGVASAWEFFIGPLEEAIYSNSSMLRPKKAVILRSRLGDDAALIGAARCAGMEKELR
jgi:glucokinase